MTAAPYTGRRIQDAELPPRSSDRQREEAPQSLPRRRNCGHSRAERQMAQKCAPLPAIGSAGAPDRRGRPAGRCSQDWPSRRMRSSPGRNSDGAILAVTPRVAKSAASPAPEANPPQKRAPGHRLCRRTRPPRLPCRTLFAGLAFPQDAFIARSKQRRRNPCRHAPRRRGCGHSRTERQIVRKSTSSAPPL